MDSFAVRPNDSLNPTPIRVVVKSSASAARVSSGVRPHLELFRVSSLRVIAFWLFVYLSISPLLASVLVFSGVNIPFPVFRIFESAPLVWRIAFFSSGILAVLTAYHLRDKKRAAGVTAILFLSLFIPSFKVAFGHISFGVWIAAVATTLALLVSFRAKDEV